MKCHMHCTIGMKNLSLLSPTFSWGMNKSCQSSWNLQVKGTPLHVDGEKKSGYLPACLRTFLGASLRLTKAWVNKHLCIPILSPSAPAEMERRGRSTMRRFRLQLRMTPTDQGKNTRSDNYDGKANDQEKRMLSRRCEEKRGRIALKPFSF